MKAFLLAAGLGTRLRPLTYDLPKCLLPINGKPLLFYWFDLLSKHGIDEVLINCHHQKSQFFQLINRSYGFQIRDFLIDIGTMENYCKAQRDWPGLINIDNDVKL